jgi:hypothetical protein
MPLTLDELTDRAEITDALLAYSTALDVPGRRWDVWYRCFAPDAVAEYPVIGRKDPAELKELFAANDAIRLTTQHLFLNIVIDLGGDEAKVRSECAYAAVNRGKEPGKNVLIRSGLWFDDTFARTPEGWRITHRIANSRWSEATEIDAV